ncbi:hypothetical protein, conserved in T. vivax [Trypanosoma vivax Y486]|uniref:Uncharacterized protein n=1 Tax=Trypanosoma vivax (strain Y486) TaxID=1055687 RepID=F9WR78_TRYVY|nr:hypothetical protein, conserved in T. vivax [Trypanosoma vivax Y486]|eukprot:CCD20062.1 hypothetical protein, conserved in T. vivax [Trypanosoma vivax Y486]
MQKALWLVFVPANAYETSVRAMLSMSPAQCAACAMASALTFVYTLSSFSVAATACTACVIAAFTASSVSRASLATGPFPVLCVAKASSKRLLPSSASPTIARISAASSCAFAMLAATRPAACFIFPDSWHTFSILAVFTTTSCDASACPATTSATSSKTRMLPSWLFLCKRVERAERLSHALARALSACCRSLPRSAHRPPCVLSLPLPPSLRADLHGLSATLVAVFFLRCDAVVLRCTVRGAMPTSGLPLHRPGPRPARAIVLLSTARPRPGSDATRRTGAPQPAAPRRACVLQRAVAAPTCPARQAQSAGQPQTGVRFSGRDRVWPGDAPTQAAKPSRVTLAGNGSPPLPSVTRRRRAGDPRASARHHMVSAKHKRRR